MLGVALGARWCSGGLTFDLRFSDSTKQKTISPEFTGTFALELFARVSGTDGNHVNDGLTDAYVVLQSSEVSGDLFDGSITNGLTLIPFNQGRNGANGTISNDGVGDWGTSAMSMDDFHYMYAKNAVVQHAGGATGVAIDNNTWEFKIATFTLNVSAVHPSGNDETRIVMTRPGPSFPSLTLAHYLQDNATQTVTNQQFAGVYGTYVSLIGSSSTSWDGGPAGSGNEWTTAANWAGDSVPGVSAVATFGAGGSASVVGINMGTLAGNTAPVGMIRLDTDAAHDITVQNSSVVAGTLSIAGVGGIVLENRAAGRTLSLSASGAGNLALSFPSAATIDVLNANSTINLGATITSSTLITKTGAGTLIIGGNQQNWTCGLVVNAGKVVIPANSSGVCYLDTLTIAPSAALDLNDNDLVVNNGSFSTIQGLVFDGYSTTPDTNLTGITSTVGQNAGGVAILALFNNALFGVTDYPFGSGHSIATGAIVGKYTYIGDTDWDGQVTPQDYTAIDANLGATGIDLGAAWFSGDTNFDGNIDPTDYTGIDAALGLGVGNPLSSHSVPEPGFLGSAALPYLVRRKRRYRGR
jgi:autotransporter-associated beta strand protein